MKSKVMVFGLTVVFICSMVRLSQSFMAEEKATSSVLNAQKIEHDGVKLYLLIPQVNSGDKIPFEAILHNHSFESVSCGESQGFLDCQAELKTAHGESVPFKNPHLHVFSATKVMATNYAFIKLDRGDSRYWEHDLTQAFGPLAAGKYLLSIKTIIRYPNDSNYREGKPVDLEAADIAFEVQ